MSGPPVFLSRATGADLPALVAIERASSPRPWSEAHFAAELEHGSPLVLRSAAGIVAFCAFHRVLEELHVRNLAVAPAWRRRGLGRRLLALTLAHAGRAGARRACLEVRSGNRAARALYAGLGFAPAAAAPRAAPGDELSLVLHLPDSGYNP